MVVHTWNPNSQEARTGGLQVLVHRGLHIETQIKKLKHRQKFKSDFEKLSSLIKEPSFPHERR